MSNEAEHRGFNRRQMAKAAALGGALPLVGIAASGQAPGGATALALGETLFGPRRFGAKGDGKSDDTKALQSAIDAAAERGGAVLVPPGVYLISELQLRPFVALIGVPAWDYHQGGGSVLRLMDPNAKCLLNITGAFGCTIDGLSLEGGKLGKGVHGVFLNKPDYGKKEDTFRIERSQIQSFSGDGMVLLHPALHDRLQHW